MIRSHPEEKKRLVRREREKIETANYVFVFGGELEREQEPI